MSAVTIPENARFSTAGDEFLFVEIDEAMSLEANVRAMAIAQGVRDRAVPGIAELCPANASLLIRYDPDRLPAERLRSIVREAESDAKAAASSVISTRIVEVPVWYGDPYTTEVMQRFRAGFHQEPDGTDLEYSAKVNGLGSVEEFVERHHSQPWLVSMVGFVAGLPFLYQLVERERQLEVPKYLSPRSGMTPQLTLGHGGCFGSIYSVEGAGGYQMLGILAGPIFDPAQSHPDFADSMFFCRPGDIVKYRPIGEEEYRALRAQVAEGRFRYKTVPIEFNATRALVDQDGTNRALVEALNAA